MATDRSRNLCHHLRDLAEVSRAHDASDQELLDSFVATRSEPVRMQVVAFRPRGW
jgi:hypothetical protein